MTDAVTDTSTTDTNAATGDEPTITLDTDTPVEKPIEKPAELTAEEKAAEEARRAALTDDERKAEDDAKAAAEANRAPAEYAPFKVPDGITLEGPIIDDLKAYAKTLDLNQEKTQGIVDLGVRLQQQIIAQQNEAIIATQKEWQAASRSDPEFGGEKVKENIGIAEEAIKVFTTPEYRKILKESGLGNHPEVIRTFYRIGKALQQDKTLAAPAQTAPKREETEEARAKRLYPNTPAVAA